MLHATADRKSSSHAGNAMGNWLSFAIGPPPGRRGTSDNGDIDGETAPPAVVLAAVVGFGDFLLHVAVRIRGAAGDGVGARLELGRQHEWTPGEAAEVRSQKPRLLPVL